MSISIYSSGQRLGKLARLNMRNAVQRTLAKLALSYGSARVVISDLNGPRGGVDKECSIQINVKRLGPVIVRGRAESAREAFTLALSKLASVIRKMASKRARFRKRNTNYYSNYDPLIA